MFICWQTIKESVKKFEEGVKTQMERIDTGHLIVQKIGLALWVLCIIGIVVYFTRPVSVQE